MEPNIEEGNLLEIMDLARTLRQEQLFIQQEQAAFEHLAKTLASNSTAITKLAYICAQQRQNLNDLILSRPESGPITCCRRAKNYDNVKFVDAKKVMNYQHAIAYEDLFNHLYRSPYLLALSLATGDRLAEITPQHMSSIIHTISTGLYGNAIITKDVEMVLKLLRELIEIQIIGSDNPRRMLRTNSSAFARLYHRLNESMFSAKIFLTAALFEPIMGMLSDSDDTILDVDPDKVVQRLSNKERLRRFGAEDSNDYKEKILKFNDETITKLHTLAKSFIDSLTGNWSLFPSTLRWLVQTMSHLLKQAHFSDKIINEIITDMVFTHFICPAIVSPDIMGIIDAPISEPVRFNLIQIGQIIQMMALAKFDVVEAKFAQLHAKFKANMVTNLIDLLLVSESGEDVVAILSQQSDFERSHLLSTQNELVYFVRFFRILIAKDEFDVSMEEREKLKKILAHLPETSLPDSSQRSQVNGGADLAQSGGSETHAKERSKQSLISLGKATKSKIAKSMSFNTNGGGGYTATDGAASATHALVNGQQVGLNSSDNHTPASGSANASAGSSTNSSPMRALPADLSENEQVLLFNIYNSDENKLQPLTEEEVLKMNSIGQEIENGDGVHITADAESCNLENTIDKSSMANGFDGIDGIDGMSDVMAPLHAKTARFSLSHDDASDNLEAVSEVPSNHSVTSSLELEEEENDQNDNLSDMVSANVSGRGSPNISGRDTPSSQVTDGDGINNTLPMPQMQKLLSKARSDIEDKFCKFELKKFEGDETVSIISDTWSTDVLASDSETIDALERERDRNFSTPLIPSAVVLPGDNNFDALSRSTGGATRSNYLDVSDQRSESNWSTDVLASDSEKLAEVDTDDNLSITAKSDITDAGGRSECERDLLAAAISAPPRGEMLRTHGRNARGGGGGGLSAGVGCGFRVTNSNSSYSTVDRGTSTVAGDEGRGSGSSAGSNASERSQEDSAFFDAINSYEDASNAIVDTAEVVTGNAPKNNDANSDTMLTSASALHHYQGYSSLARSSVRTTNQLSGENSFQQNYKSGMNGGKETFLVTPRMRRQTSAESSISNQSVTMEDATNLVEKHPKVHHKGGMKKKKHTNNITPTRESKDLIDFTSDFHENRSTDVPVVDGISEAASNTMPSSLADIFNDDAVEHRRISSEQRSAVFDGRRNGIMAMRGGGGGGNTDSGSVNTNAPPILRRHQSLNYENHEIMINTTIPKQRMSAMPNLKCSSQTDDDKNQQQIMLLCAKTEELKLNDKENDNDANAAGHNTAEDIADTSVTIKTISAAPAAATDAETTSPKPTKSTGAIPKSISFDASADKKSANNLRPTPHRNARVHTDVIRHAGVAGGGGGAAANSSLFNKLKQGFFKHRRNNKAHRYNANSTAAAAAGADEYSRDTTSSRSVSFSTNTSEISLDLVGGGVGGAIAGSGRNGTAAYCDINEDILAKYRRKVSTSSEATNSDSTSGVLNQKDPDDAAIAAAAKLPNAGASLHDKVVSFNLIKKKIRTVLSKTDLHTGDFRHTTYSNASPLLTYLQIQLAQAINLQNFQQISYVSEAMRCISTLEPSQHVQLLEELQSDIQKRQNYLQYLMRYRQNLLLVMENVEQFKTRLHSESSTCNRYLMAIFVRLFVEKRQAKIDDFQEEFARLTVSDDKIDLIEEFIEQFMQELFSSGGLLYGMPEWQAIEARISIERILLQRMYQQVMFPNEDADLSRDSVLSEHIRKLQRVICPSHPALCIPQEYLSEAPWTFAQQQLSYISAYKTPHEKLQCVIRCISSIMSLLHMSSGRLPAADDILPVLIYVVIMANPPYLLSTVEYITCFIGEKLDGQDQFHWTLFGSVVKFIKTMDYLN